MFLWRQVVLVDRAASQLERAVEGMRASLVRLAAKGRLPGDTDPGAVLGRLRSATEFEVGWGGVGCGRLSCRLSTYEASAASTYLACWVLVAITVPCTSPHGSPLPRRRCLCRGRLACPSPLPTHPPLPTRPQTPPGGLCRPWPPPTMSWRRCPSARLSRPRCSAPWTACCRRTRCWPPTPAPFPSPGWPPPPAAPTAWSACTS